jgi:nucleotide-binding universal stress UspA family protein
MTGWMKEPMFLVLIAGLAAVALSGYSLWHSHGSETVEGPRLRDVLAEVKEELRLARQKSDLKALPSLSKVEVELEVMISESTEGSVSASVVPLEASGKETRASSESRTQKVKVVLAPPQRQLTQEVESLEGHPLAQAIVDVAEDLASSAETAPKLDVASVEFNVKFVVVRSRAREAGFALKVLGANRKTVDSGQATNDVKLVFAPPKAEDAQAKSWDG